MLRQMNMGGSQVKDFSPLDKIPSFNLLFITSELEPYLNTMTRSDVEVVVYR